MHNLPELLSNVVAPGFLLPLAISICVIAIVFKLVLSANKGSRTSAESIPVTIAKCIVLAAIFGATLFFVARFSGIHSAFFLLVLAAAGLAFSAVLEKVLNCGLSASTSDATMPEPTKFELPGVTVFGQVLRRTPLRLLNPSVYFNASQKDWPAVLEQADRARAIHFYSFLFTIPLMVWAIWNFDLWAFGALALFQLLLNLYPMLHLRSVRRRIVRMMSRTSLRNAGSLATRINGETEAAPAQKNL
ncbi:MAG: hypothetical protein ABI905_03270 [Betaproteobacteria bacterium]